MTKPLVSIIVPVYNASKFLSPCLTSLLNQSFSDIEIILVDDGSTDETPLLCDYFARNDARVHVCHQENQGVSVARNNGIELACGSYVTFVDADDWIDLNTCEIFAKSLQNYEYDLFCYSAVYHKQKKIIKSFLFGSDIPLMTEGQKEELHCKVMTPWSPAYVYNCNTRFAGSSCGKFYRTKILKEKGFAFTAKLLISEDVLFNVLAMDAFEIVGYTTKAFYHYEQRENSAQNRFRPNSMVFFQKVIDEIQKWMAVASRSQRMHDAANTLFVHYLFGALKEDFFHKENPEKQKAVVKLGSVLRRKQIQEIVRGRNKNYFSFAENILAMMIEKRNLLAIRFIMFLYNRVL